MVAAKKHLTEKQYLALEEKSDVKHEYFDGEVHAMVGGTSAHALVTMNVAIALGRRLQKGPCRVFSPDLRVRIDESGAYFYPDVSVVCGPAAFATPQKTSLLNPTVVVEVTSRSTESRDQGFKRTHYMLIPSLQEMFFVPQKPGVVEHMSRQADGSWRVVLLPPTRRLVLAHPKVSIPISEFFRGTDRD